MAAPPPGEDALLPDEHEHGIARSRPSCSRRVWESRRRTALDRAGLLVRGHVERHHGATNLAATRLDPLRIGL